MPAGLTYEPIATTTASGSTTSVTFSSISAAYTDLVLVVNGSANGSSAYLRVNGDTGSNYSITRISGNGGSASSNRTSNSTSAEFGGLYNDNNTNIIHFMNYANTTTYKTFLARTNPVQSGAAAIGASVCLWRSTSAINSITFLCDVNIVSGSTLTLYGIKAA